jgi:hypothetical protein
MNEAKNSQVPILRLARSRWAVRPPLSLVPLGTAEDGRVETNRDGTDGG